MEVTATATETATAADIFWRNGATLRQWKLDIGSPQTSLVNSFFVRQQILDREIWAIFNSSGVDQIQLTISVIVLVYRKNDHRCMKQVKHIATITEGLILINFISIYRLQLMV